MRFMIPTCRSFIRSLAALLAVAIGAWILQCGAVSAAQQQKAQHPLIHSSERHLRNLKQLTFSGENAEAYFSNDDRWLIFQSHETPESCDQIFTMDLNGQKRRLVSTGKGRTTCSYIFPG